MSAVATQQPIITSLDRFGLTLCLAIIMHALIILGVSFAPEDIIQPRYETMEIILVQQTEKIPPKEADHLGQANLEGGGEQEDKARPATPTPAPFPKQTPEITASAQEKLVEPTPPAPPAIEETIVEPKPPSANNEESLLLAQSSEIKHNTPKPVKEEQIKEQTPAELETKQDSQQAEEKLAPPKPKPIPKKQTPSAAALLTSSIKMASLSAEVRQKIDARAKRPKRKFVSTSTKEFKFASYMESWRAKVERVGNLNYPEEARINKLDGSLILDVALNRDGSINEIIIRKPSGHKVLDDAAIRIVELAAPYAEFPETFNNEVDILHITRTWRFKNSTGFR